MQRSILEAKSADIVVVTKREKQNVPLSFKTFFRRAISWFTRSKGEGPTKAVHVGIIVYINEIPYVLEALWFVTLTPYDEWKREHQSFCIWRNTELSEDECIAVENEAIKYIGAFYGIAKIGLHALDGLIAKITSKEYLKKDIQFVAGLLLMHIMEEQMNLSEKITIGLLLIRCGTT